MSDELHRSRTAWPGPMSIAGLDPGHDHELPAPLVQRTRLLTRAVVIFGVSLAAIGTMLVLLIVDRGRARDIENERTNERINDSICDLLDQLPEGGLLDRPRGKYGCGPGIPLSELTPEDAARIQQQRGQSLPPMAVAPRSATPEASSPDPMGGAGATLPSQSGTDPESVPPDPGTEPTPAPPLVDLGPITRPVCEVAQICF